MLVSPIIQGVKDLIAKPSTKHSVHLTNFTQKLLLGNYFFFWGEKSCFVVELNVTHSKHCADGWIE